MTPVTMQTKLVIFFLNVLFYTSCHLAELQICHTCNGTVLDQTEVGRFCSSSAGRVEGRCCLQQLNSTQTPHVITGLDLSNCSLNQIADLQDASTAVVIDLSSNPIVNISDAVFQGCAALNDLLLPSSLSCPGGNASWETVSISEGILLCRGQRSMCNETGHLSLSCPENSLCAPDGPGFFRCDCVHGYHGYKCLREGEFPFIQVFSPLAGATVLLSLVLWATERRKAKSN
ncbi:hypothetical protein NHX12_026763 [Muraenolepis orangiensis]|uniref:EGF-like domain-containing protein n=1 Tax=Muraenolepis orangiensis TaxID=630683 RepID=A0A9Q0EHZ4_9TELE|nr:hypothetical protein NHX12_026763 [Muraenolepis orangiensis]